MCTLDWILWSHEFHWNKLMRVVAWTGGEANMGFQSQIFYCLKIWVGNAITSSESWVPFIRKFAFLVPLGSNWFTTLRKGDVENVASAGTKSHVTKALWSQHWQNDGPIMYYVFIALAFVFCYDYFIKWYTAAFEYRLVLLGTRHVMERVYYPRVICSIYHSNRCGGNA